MNKLFLKYISFLFLFSLFLSTYCVYATSTTSTPATYTVIAGKSLMTISFDVYGTHQCWKTILKANPQITNSNDLEKGQVLTIPDSSFCHHPRAHNQTLSKFTDADHSSKKQDAPQTKTAMKNSSSESSAIDSQSVAPTTLPTLAKVITLEKTLPIQVPVPVNIQTQDEGDVAAKAYKGFAQGHKLIFQWKGKKIRVPTGTFHLP